MPTLQINLFAGFHVQRDTQTPIRFPTQKVRALLAYLAVEAQTSHPRDKLMALFWPEQSQSSASNNLRQTLSRLRAELPADTIRVQDNEIQFNPASDCQVDVTSFLEKIRPSRDTGRATGRDTGRATGRATSRVGSLNPINEAQRWQQVEEATALYRGDFLAGFSLPDSPAFEEWALLKREWLRRLALDTLSQLAEHLQETRQYSLAIDSAWRQVEIDPLREEAHQQLIRLFALSGRRSEAVAQYERCQQLLQAELGVEPAQTTIELVQRILRDELQPPSASPFPEPVEGNGDAEGGRNHSYSQSASNLPAQLLPLIGRDTEVTACIHLLQDPAIRLLTILGPGGMGKTHLAIEIGQQLANQSLQSLQSLQSIETNQPASPFNSPLFNDGITFVSLVALQSPDAILATIAAALRFSFRSGVEPMTQLQDYLRPRRLLLLLDNFEHLLTGASTLVELLAAAPNVKALITSRAALNVTGEQLYPLEGLDYPPIYPLVTTQRTTTETPEMISPFGAVRLFVQSAHRRQPSFRLNEANAPSVATICRTVQGMPLSLLLAAAWSQLLSPNEIVEQLTASTHNAPLDFLESDWQGMNERQRSLRRVFEHSWLLLSDDQQQAFARLSVFRGGFRFETARAVTHISLRSLLALVNHSLVRRADNGRYDLHELVRQYAEEKLRTSDDNAKTRRTHANHFASFLTDHAQVLRTAGELTALAALDDEIENIRAAWQWFAQQGVAQQADYEQLGRMIEGIAWFYSLRGRRMEGLTVFQFAVDALEAQAESRGRIENLSPIGMRVGVAILLWLRSLQPETTARETLAAMDQRVEALLNHPRLAAIDTRAERAFLLLWQCDFAWRDDLDEAERLAKQSLALYQELGQQERVADLLETLSRISYSKNGPTSTTKNYTQQVLQIRQTLGDQRGIAHVLQQLGEYAHDNGAFDEAEALQRQALTVVEAMGNPREIARQLYRLGNTLNLSGKFAEALKKLEQSLLIWKDLGERGPYSISLDEYAYCRLNYGEFAGLETQLREAMQIMQELGMPPTFPYSTLGSLFMLEGKYAEAQECAQRSVDLSRGYLETGLALNLGYQAYVECTVRNRQKTLSIILEALHLARRLDHAFDASISLGALGLLWADERKPNEALELLGATYQFPALRMARWYVEFVGGSIRRCAATTLSPEEIEAAIQRGLTRNIWETADWVLGELQGEL